MAGGHPAGDRGGKGPPCRGPGWQGAALQGTGVDAFVSKATRSRQLLNSVGKGVSQSIMQSYRTQRGDWVGEQGRGGLASHLLLWGVQSTMRRCIKPKLKTTENCRKAITGRLGCEG